jgi:hypothetical protein
MAVDRQRISKHISAEMNQHATIEELLEVVFSVWSVLRPYNEDQQEKLGSSCPIFQSLERSKSHNITKTW